MKKNKEDIVSSWIKKADRDLEVSKRELKLPEPLTDKKDPSILKLKDYGAELSSFAVEVRYPEFEEPALEDTKIAVKVAEKFENLINKKIP